MTSWQYAHLVLIKSTIQSLMTDGQWRDMAVVGRPMRFFHHGAILGGTKRWDMEAIGTVVYEGTEPVIGGPDAVHNPLVLFLELALSDNWELVSGSNPGFLLRRNVG